MIVVNSPRQMTWKSQECSSAVSLVFRRLQRNLYATDAPRALH